MANAIMFGPCEWSGVLTNYDRTDRVGEIGVPTLLLVGGHDPSTPATTRFYQRLISRSEMVVFDSSGHLPMQDEPEHYNQVIRTFLRRVEAAPSP